MKQRERGGGRRRGKRERERERDREEEGERENVRTSLRVTNTHLLRSLDAALYALSSHSASHFCCTIREYA